MKNALIVDGKIDALSSEPFSAENVEVPDNAELGGAWNGSTYAAPIVSDYDKALLITLTRKQLRLGLVKAGKPATFIGDLIAAMPDGEEKQTAFVLWEEAQVFHRDHPLIVQLIPATGITEAEFDTMWIAAAEL